MTPHRALSGWLLALSSTGLAIAAHGLAGGGLPDTALVIPVTAVIAWAATALADRLRGVVPLTAALAVVQLGMHELLARAAGTHGDHAHLAAAAPVVDGWAMLAGHALATLIIAALLARATNGLSLVSAAVEWLLGRLRAMRLAPVPAPAAIGVVSAAPARPGQLLEVLLRRVSSRRGPPVRS